MMSPGPGLLRQLPVGGEEEDRVRHRHLLLRAHVAQLHPALEMPRGEANEGHPVAVPRVHVRLHLEDETRDGDLFRGDLARLRPLDRGFGAVFSHSVHQLAHSEGVDRGAEPDRRHVSFQECAPVEGGEQFPRHLDLVEEGLQQVRRDVLRQLRVRKPRDLHRLRDPVPVGTVHQFQPVVQQVVAADELPPRSDGPARGRHVDGEVLLDLVHYLERVAALAVHLVAEREDRQVPQPTHLEELAGLALHPLRAVDHHDRGIHRRQRAVGILREVGVSRRVHEVEAVIAILERHRGGGDGDPTLLLQLHEVGPRAPRLALGADLPRHLDGAAEEEELLGQRGLARVGMRDDGEGAAARDLGRQGGAVVQHARADSRSAPATQYGRGERATARPYPRERSGEGGQPSLVQNQQERPAGGLQGREAIRSGPTAGEASSP